MFYSFCLHDVEETLWFDVVLMLGCFAITGENKELSNFIKKKDNGNVSQNPQSCLNKMKRTNKLKSINLKSIVTVMQL